MKDPVCNTIIKNIANKIIYNGHEYYFCCASCRWAFENNPKQYILER